MQEFMEEVGKVGGYKMSSIVGVCYDLSFVLENISIWIL